MRGQSVTNDNVREWQDVVKTLTDMKQLTVMEYVKMLLEDEINKYPSVEYATVGKPFQKFSDTT